MERSPDWLELREFRKRMKTEFRRTDLDRLVSHNEGGCASS